jgi:nicotinamide phosphoribosyltransferase
MKTNALSLMSIIVRTDSYKLSQWRMYPADTVNISSYIESRGEEPESVFFGLQAFIKDYLLDPISMADINRAELVVRAHGLPFNREGWEIIVHEHNGLLPLTIEAVPEGTVMPTHNVQVQIRLTKDDARLSWLVSYIETCLLRGIWYPSTVATKSRKFKKMIAAALLRSSDIPVDEQIAFKLHDFGARGCSSGETAMLGGMAHLVNFMGTDTFEALFAAMHYYNTEAVVGFSIPASEHSTITSWGRENETEAYRNMITQFSGKGKLYACVSDSYDIWNAISNSWGRALREQVIASGGTLVVRPDSGKPVEVVVRCLQLLDEAFGSTINGRGYKVLHPSVRLIQGDGINEDSLPEILEAVMRAGYSIDNVAFGMGGGLLQAWNRDTLRYAMKASARKTSAGDWVGFSKNPITDSGKRSKEGRLGLISEGGIGPSLIRTVTEDFANEHGNLLREVYVDGELLVEDTFEAIRERAVLKLVEYNEIQDRY